MSHFEWKQRALHLRLKVVPKASNDAIGGLLGDRLKVTITAPPMDGKANSHLIRWFAKLCGVSRSQVALVAGESSRNKTIAISEPATIPPELQLSDPEAD